MARTINGADELKSLVGQHLGSSDWLEITQERVNTFAEATGDHQWIHVDPEKAKNGPFGGTIAHGYLTMSLGPVLLPQIVTVTGFSMALNYGLNKLRFPSPVPVGSKLRLSAQLAAVEDVAGGVQTTYVLTFEVDGQEKPACVAEALYRWLV
ncbi:MAG: enoyl-CoA hydratase [Acidimicrobiales bacterium]|jgi:acyl dehydratase|nr:enoyl-CoA hydratase [Acidimicrobiales bacterium]